MSSPKPDLISIVVPVFNEADGLNAFHKSLIVVVEKITKSSYEVIYCDDGSNDDSANLIGGWNKENNKVKLIKLSRNFGKENALSAGIAFASGEAIITVDADGQHPVDLIPKFIEAWKSGVQVVVGVRNNTKDTGILKRIGSWSFYKIFNRLTKQKLIVGSTDFRLIDQAVQQEFLKLPENDRITRGLIDWLGFNRQFIYFDANPRTHGSPSYGYRKLIKLAINSFVSLTTAPLYVLGYLGVFITLTSMILGISVLIEQLLLGDPLHWKFTGTAMLSILLVFLVGIVLMSQGILALYLSLLNNQSKQRPLYVIDYSGSRGINKNPHA